MALDLSPLERVIDYPAGDMTVTAQAGIRLTALQTVLRAKSQQLPIDVPQADQATLGGAMATNTCGPRRYGYGTWRDYVIGVSVVNDQGLEVKAGGRVVKNVAGYDLCKLYVGSLGTLGIITQVTLKLRPVPEEHAIAVVPVEPSGTEALLAQARGSQSRPVCIELLNPAAAVRLSQCLSPERLWLLVIGFDGNRGAVNWQVQQIIKELSPGCCRGIEVRIGAAASRTWQALMEYSASSDSPMSLKANVLPSRTAQFCQQATASCPGIAIQAHAGNGIVLAHAPAGLTIDRGQSLLSQWQEWARAAHGNAIVLRCPASWKSSLKVWGHPRQDAWLMSEIKRKLDPQGLFNPGRFVGAI
jgi:glycolate oxidase FAD binding subunit